MFIFQGDGVHGASVHKGMLFRQARGLRRAAVGIFG
jgi:hypothetical protein